MPLYRKIREEISASAREGKLPSAYRLAAYLLETPNLLGQNSVRHTDTSVRHTDTIESILTRIGRAACRRLGISDDLTAVRVALRGNREGPYAWNFETMITSDGSRLLISDVVRVTRTGTGETRAIAWWHSTRCSECNIRFHNADIRSGRCHSCGESGESEESEESEELASRFQVLSSDANVLDYFPDARTASETSTETLFGVELEYEFCNANVVHSSIVRDIVTFNDVIVKSDGSLREGIEINTIPTPLGAQRTLVQHLLKGIPRRTVYASKRCGLHVHVSRRGLTEDAMARIIVLTNAFSIQSLIQNVARRGATQWAHVVPKTLDTARRDLRGNIPKYVAVNTQHAHTLEFRIFKSAVSQATVCAAIEFCAAVVAFASNVSDIDALCDPVVFCSYVAREQRRFKNLARWLKRIPAYTGIFVDASNQKELALCA